MPGFNQFRHAATLLIRLGLLKTKLGTTKKVSGLHCEHYTDLTVFGLFRVPGQNQIHDIGAGRPGMHQITAGFEKRTGIRP